MAANVEHFVDLYGKPQCGFLTITFAEDLDWREAQRRFNNFARRHLRPLFRDYIRVLEFQRSGRPHYHLLVVAEGDIATGFNWDHYDRVRQWSRYTRRIEPKPQGSLNRTELLADLHERLNAAGPKYGLGRMELVPIRSNAEAIGKYVGGYLSKGLPGRKPEHKGARSVCYSRNFDRAYKGRFAWLQKGAIWRAKVAIWAARHGCSNLDEVKALLGPRWAYHHRSAIEETHHEHTAEHTAEQHTITPARDDKRGEDSLPSGGSDRRAGMEERNGLVSRSGERVGSSDGIGDVGAWHSGAQRCSQIPGTSVASGGKVAAAQAPKGKSLGAAGGAAAAELPVCEQRANVGRSYQLRSLQPVPRQHLQRVLRFTR